MFDRIRKFFARFYNEEPGMLMPAVKEPKEDDDFTPEQQRAAALQHQHLQGDAGDDAPADDVDLPPHGPSA